MRASAQFPQFGAGDGGTVDACCEPVLNAGQPQLELLPASPALRQRTGLAAAGNQLAAGLRRYRRPVRATSAGSSWRASNGASPMTSSTAPQGPGALPFAANARLCAREGGGMRRRLTAAQDSRGQQRGTLVTSISVTPARGSSSVLSSAFAALAFSVSAGCRRPRSRRRRAPSAPAPRSARGSARCGCASNPRAARCR